MSQQPGDHRPESTPPGGPAYGQPTPPEGPGYGQPTQPGVPVYGQSVPSGGPQYGQPTPPGGPAYGQQGGYHGGYQAGYGSPYAAPRSTNTLAIVSLVTSIIGLGIVGIITGHIARRQIRQTGEAGDGLALAGLIIGYLITLVEVLAVIAFIGLFAIAGSSTY